MNLLLAAKEVFREAWDASSPIGRPYLGYWRGYELFYISGPSIDMDWLAGTRLEGVETICAVSFRAYSAYFHIYNRAQRCGDAPKSSFEYDNPAFPHNLLGRVADTIQLWESLWGLEQEQYRDFLASRKRDGFSVITVNDIPPGRYPNEDGYWR